MTDNCSQNTLIDACNFVRLSKIVEKLIKYLFKYKKMLFSLSDGNN